MHAPQLAIIGAGKSTCHQGRSGVFSPHAAEGRAINGIDSFSLKYVLGLVVVGCPTGVGLRLHADELEAEIEQPVEESV
jgi:hypothetical protein